MGWSRHCRQAIRFVVTLALVSFLVESPSSAQDHTKNPGPGEICCNNLPAHVEELLKRLQTICPDAAPTLRSHLNRLVLDMAGMLANRGAKTTQPCKQGERGEVPWLGGQQPSEFDGSAFDGEIPAACILVKDVSRAIEPIILYAARACAPVPECTCGTCPCESSTVEVKPTVVTVEPIDVRVWVDRLARLPKPVAPQIPSHPQVGLTPMFVLRPGIPQLAAASAPLVFEGGPPGGGFGAMVAPYRIYEMDALVRRAEEVRTAELKKLAKRLVDELVDVDQPRTTSSAAVGHDKAKMEPDPPETLEAAGGGSDSGVAEAAGDLWGCAAGAAEGLIEPAVRERFRGKIVDAEVARLADQARKALLQAANAGLRNCPEDFGKALADVFDEYGGWGWAFLRSLNVGVSGGAFPTAANQILSGDRLATISLSGDLFVGDDPLYSDNLRECLKEQASGASVGGVGGLEDALHGGCLEKGPVPFALGWGVDVSLRRAGAVDLQFDGWGGWLAAELRNAHLAGTLLGRGGQVRVDGADGPEYIGEGYGGLRGTASASFGSLSVEGLVGCWVSEAELSAEDRGRCLAYQGGTQVSAHLGFGISATAGALWRCDTDGDCEGRAIGSLGWLLAPKLSQTIADLARVATAP